MAKVAILLLGGGVDVSVNSVFGGGGADGAEHVRQFFGWDELAVGGQLSVDSESWYLVANEVEV